MKTYIVCYTLRVLVTADNEEDAASAPEFEDPHVTSKDKKVEIESVEVEYEEVYEVET